MDRLIDVQIAASAWSVRQVVEACRGLSNEQFNRSLEIGPPPHTLQATLAHTIGAWYFFADNFDDRKFVAPPKFAACRSSVSGLLELLDEAEPALRNAVQRFLESHADGLDGRLTWQWGGWNISAAQALAQVFDHTTHHRVQCVHMLKKLGVDPLPEAYPLRWPGPKNSGRRD